MPLGGSTAATLVVKITTDASQAARGFTQAGDSAGRFQRGMGTAARWGGVASAALVAFGVSAFDAASAAEQAGGAVDAVFKSQADQIHSFADEAAEATGLSSSAYEQMASVFGAQLKNMGVASDDLVPMTDDLISLGADLAAQFGGETSDAVDALSSLLRGERDPIERYGVSIKEADVKARKAAMGLDGLTGEADKQATTMATLSLLTEQTADANGAFAREASTAAGAQARANAEFEDAKASIGQALLPVVAKLATVFADVARFIGENSLAFQIFAGVIIGVTSAVWLFNAALAANPIVLVGIAVAALVAGIILLWKNCKTFRTIVKKAGEIAVKAFEAVKKAVDVAWDWVKKIFQWLRSNWPKVLAILTGPVGVAVLMIVKHWRTIREAAQKVLSWIRSNWPKIVAVLTGPMGVAVLVIAKHWRTIIGWIRQAIDWLATKLVAAFRVVALVAANVFAIVRRVVQVAIVAFSNAAAWLRGVLSQAFIHISRVASVVFAAVRTAVQIVIVAFQNAANWLRGVLAEAFVYVSQVASLVMTAISGSIGWVIDKANWLATFLRSTVAAAFQVVQWVATAAMSGISGAIGWVIDKANWLASFLRSSLAGAFQVVQWVGTVAFNAIIGPIQWVIDKVQWLINVISNIHWPSPPSWVTSGVSKVLDWLPLMAPAPPVLARPYRYAVTTPVPYGPTMLGARATRSGAAGGVTINVSGALDPDGVARQIERLLAGRARRVGGPRLVGVR